MSDEPFVEVSKDKIKQLVTQIQAAQLQFLKGGMHERFALGAAVSACVTFIEHVAPETDTGVLAALQAAVSDRALGIDEPIFRRDDTLGRPDRLALSTARARAGLVACVDFLVAPKLNGSPMTFQAAYWFVDRETWKAGLRTLDGERCTAKLIISKRAELQKTYSVRNRRLGEPPFNFVGLPMRRAHALAVELSLNNARKHASAFLLTMCQHSTEPVSRQKLVMRYLGMLRASLPAKIL